MKLSDVKPDCVPDVEPQAQLSNNEISGLCSTPLTNGDLLNKYTTKSNGKLPSIENDKRLDMTWNGFLDQAHSQGSSWPL